MGEKRFEVDFGEHGASGSSGASETPLAGNPFGGSVILVPIVSMLFLFSKFLMVSLSFFLIVSMSFGVGSVVP